jgi:hypothetical protein
MKKAFLILWITLFPSCSPFSVSYDYDKQANFSKYKTYAFAESAMKLPVEQLVLDRIIKAIETEMAAKGFTKSEQPDVLVDLRAMSKVETQTSVTSTGNYGYWNGHTSQATTNQYTVGTLFVNLVDKSTERIVWQGWATKTLNEDAGPQTRDQNIRNGIHEIFTKYPPAVK